MEKVETKLPHSRRKFQVSLTKDEVDGFFAHALDHLKSNIKVPGFRPGKAPLELIKEQIDKQALREEAYALSVRKSWNEIISGIKEVPIQDPEVTLETFEEGKPGSLEIEFDVRPEVEVGPWEKIKIKEAKDEVVSEKEINEFIDSLKRAHAKTVVKLEPAKKGDKVHVNFEGSLKGVRQDKLTSKNFPLILGHSNTIPGFDDKLVGLRKGDKKSFKLTFPKDHFDKSLASKVVDFEVEIEDVFDVILPELDSEFAGQFGHKNPEGLKKAIREDLETRKRDEQFVSLKAEWLAEFHKLIKTDVPETLIKSEIERSRESWQQFLQSRNLSAESWLKDHGLTMEQMEANWRHGAIGSVEVGLGLAEVAKKLRRELKSNEEFQQLLDELVRQSLEKT